MRDSENDYIVSTPDRPLRTPTDLQECTLPDCLVIERSSFNTGIKEGVKGEEDCWTEGDEDLPDVMVGKATPCEMVQAHMVGTDSTHSKPGITTVISESSSSDEGSTSSDWTWSPGCSFTSIDRDRSSQQPAHTLTPEVAMQSLQISSKAGGVHEGGREHPAIPNVNAVPVMLATSSPCDDDTNGITLIEPPPPLSLPTPPPSSAAKRARTRIEKYHSTSARAAAGLGVKVSSSYLETPCHFRSVLIEKFTLPAERTACTKLTQVGRKLVLRQHKSTTLVKREQKCPGIMANIKPRAYVDLLVRFNTWTDQPNYRSCFVLPRHVRTLLLNRRYIHETASLFISKEQLPGKVGPESPFQHFVHAGVVHTLRDAQVLANFWECIEGRRDPNRNMQYCAWMDNILGNSNSANKSGPASINVVGTVVSPSPIR